MPVLQPLNSREQAQAPAACSFCKRNRESARMYSSHQLHDAQGRVTCPMLRRYVCAGCGGTGDNAHTRSYCPNVVSAREQREQQRQQQQQQQQQILMPSMQAPRAVASGAQWSWRDAGNVPINAHTYKPRHETGGSGGAHLLAQAALNQRPPARPASDIELGSNRAFHNMSRVTNSQYNSAGRLRVRGHRADQPGGGGRKP